MHVSLPRISNLNSALRVSTQNYDVSSRVDEVGTFVTEITNFLLGLSFDQVIAFARLTKVILTAQHEVHSNGTTEQAGEHIREDNAVAGHVSWLVCCHIDVGRDDTVHVTPTDDYADHDTTLERAFYIVGGPRKSIGDCRVDACRTKESSGILDVRIAAAKQHSETDATRERDGHVAVATPFGTVS